MGTFDETIRFRLQAFVNIREEKVVVGFFFLSTENYSNL